MSVPTYLAACVLCASVTETIHSDDTVSLAKQSSAQHLVCVCLYLCVPVNNSHTFPCEDTQDLLRTTSARALRTEWIFMHEKPVSLQLDVR